jgi:hypothetical protein
MNNCIFLSQYLKVKNNKIYLLSCNDIIDNAYYINCNDIILSNKLIIDDKIINYSLKIDIENLIIRCNINKLIPKNDFIKLMYIIEQHISGIININNLYDNFTERKNLNYYNNLYKFYIF